MDSSSRQTPGLFTTCLDKIRNHLYKVRKRQLTATSESKHYWLNRSQQTIIDLAKKRDTIRLIPVGFGGSIQHYFHFIFGLVLPVSILMRKTPTHVTFVVPRCGPFTDVLQSIFPTRLLIDDSPQQCKLPFAELVSMHPAHIQIDEQTLIRFRQDIAERLGLELAPSSCSVVLIERLAPHPFFLSDEAEEKDGGSNRRSILNHEQLSETLRASLKDTCEFRNVQLENMDFADQIAAFNAASLVIGQHGAGLTNVCWMNSGAQVLEIRTAENTLSFERLCQSNRLQYLPYQVKEEHVSINLNDFLKLIRTSTTAQQYLQQS